MKLGTSEHIKFKRLRAKLRLPDYAIVGVLESLWQFTARNTPDGVIGVHSDEDIESWIGWDQEPGQLIAALVECRWIDRVDDGRRLVVHDWHEHAPNWVLAGQAAKKARENRRSPQKHPQERSQEVPEERVNSSQERPQNNPETWSSDASSGSSETAPQAPPPYLTIPNQSIPNQVNPSLPDPPDPHPEGRSPRNAAESLTGMSVPDADFRRWWSILPEDMRSGEQAAW